ncbi:MAG: response regulator [Pegethrix bostrychoides GSE-TBD4-15B]|uniref:Response regulator n=1 Tax=Pegethrix bostrychoides GSE-TBD4-15B TaxID=2839662 RepID=A0A951P9X8_9CYAN|nr:response regulator [Pegethrix bostrychoides GSE-TBD4-15B]
MEVLLVEDDHLLAVGTARLLERLGGHQVVILSDPAAIFRHCETAAVDLVIMDINLPGAYWKGEKVDGALLCRYLKAQSQVPIIIVTAYCLPTQQQALLSQSGADYCYLKPVTDYEAFLAVMSQLDQQFNRKP